MHGGVVEPAQRSERLPDGLYRFVWRTSARHQPWLVLLSVAVFLLDLVPIELQRRIINEAIQRKALPTIVWMSAAYAAVVVLHGSTKLALNIYRGWVSERANRKLRLLTCREAEEGAERPHEGVRISIVVAEVEPIGGFVGAAISEPLLHAGALLSVFGYMLVLQPWMAVVVIGLFLPQGVVVPLMQRAINRRTRRRIAVLREMSGGIVDDAKEGGWAGGRFERCVERVYDLAMQILRRNVALNFLMNGLHHLGTAGILLVGGWLVVEGRTEVGTVVAFISGLARIKDPWDDFVKFFQEVTNARVKYRLLASALNGERRDGD